MASNVKFSVALKNAQQNAITTMAGANAILELMSLAQPANPDTAITTQQVLSQHTCNAVFAPGAANGVLTLNAISAGVGTAAAGAGTVASWFRLTTAGGTPLIDGTVGINGADLNLVNTNIAQNQAVDITGFSIANAN